MTNNTHYVYGLEDPITGEFYIGSRTCADCLPSEDTDYRGSYVTWKPEDESRLVKYIICDEFITRNEADDYERELINRYINKDDYPLNRNYDIPGIGFCLQGTFHSEETKRKISEKLKGIPRYEKTKRKISEKLKGENNANFGKTMSEETKRKISEKLKGENGPVAKLTWKEVNDIRRLYATGDYTQQQLADVFGVSQMTTSRIINNKRWVI